VLFGDPGISFLACRRVRGISCPGGREFIQVDETGKRPAAQCRGINYPEATNCLGIESFIACRCAYPGLRLRLIPVDGSESSKKHDKQLTFIVRVRWS
jgi:hypothetical protein